MAKTVINLPMEGNEMALTEEEAARRKKTNIRTFKIFGVFMVLLVAIVVLGENVETRNTANVQINKTRTPSKAMPYTVVFEKDNSYSSKVKFTCGISTEAKTFEERAHTAIKAALDLQKIKKADTITVFIENEQNDKSNLAVVHYSPDSRDNFEWSVMASGETGPHAILDNYDWP